VKEATKPSLSFSSDGSWLAVVEDQGASDHISIFSASWKLRKVNIHIIKHCTIPLLHASYQCAQFLKNKMGWWSFWSKLC
jgi:hypothetical protein